MSVPGSHSKMTWSEKSKRCWHVQVMREDLLSAAELGVDGVVAGMLTQEGDVDASQLSDFMLLCRSLVTSRSHPPLIAQLSRRDCRVELGMDA